MESIMNKVSMAHIVLAFAIALPMAAQQKAQPKQQSGANSQLSKANAEVASLKKQVNGLIEERDVLQQKVDEIPMTLRQEQAELFRQIDEITAQRDNALGKVGALEAMLKENQSGGDSLLRELRQAKEDMRDSNNKVESLENEIESLKAKLDDATTIKEGSLVHLGSDIIPARCLNLRRMTPSVKKASGVVVVNCLVNEVGDTIDVRLIQRLLGDETEWVIKAHEACLDAAKRLVFEPAATKGGVRVKVWQGAAFLLK
jgi:septal ring factor EnvC (AmiA/AmiB activator)